MASSTRENASGLLGVLASGWKTAVAKIWIPASFATAKFAAFGNHMLGKLDALTSPFSPSNPGLGKPDPTFRNRQILV